MKQAWLYDGRGLILGPNSPFKNIPILGMIIFCNISFRKKYILYTKKWKLMKLVVITDICIVLKNWWNTGNINRRERDKRNELSTKYNRGVNIIDVIDNCLGVTAIGLGITGVGLLSPIVGVPAVIGMKAVSIVMGLLRVVGNQAIKKMSLEIEKHEKIAMLAVSPLNTISSLISEHYQMDPFQMKTIH